MRTELVSKSVIFAFIVVAVSCAPTTRSAYLRVEDDLQDIDAPDKSYYIESDSTYLLQPSDELYITVTTAEQDANNFNTDQGAGSLGVDLLSYVIDQEGFIKIPYLNRIQVSGLTVNEAAEKIERDLSQYIFEPAVVIRMVNARITILGEVTSPGLYIVNNRPVNIFQAIGYAGDITTYGNRRKVLIIRTENDSIMKKYIDLTNDDVLASDWYTIHPEDIIYVEPMQRKILGTETVPWGLITSAISTTIVIMTFMITILN